MKLKLDSWLKLGLIATLTLVAVWLTMTVTTLPVTHRVQADSLNIASAALPSGLRVLRADHDGVVLDLTTSAYTVEAKQLSIGRFQQIRVDGADMTMEWGKPQLPRVSAMLGIPPDAKVTVRVLQDDVTLVPGRFKLLPATLPARSDEDLRPGELQYEPDATVYGRNALYPAMVARAGDAAWLRDQRLVQIELFPFQYNPAEGALTWHRHLKIEVRFDGTAAAAPPASDQRSVQDDPFEPILRRMLLNYDAARAWRASPQDYGAIQSPPPSSYPITDTTPRYKIVVDHDGLYRLTYADLQAAGMAVDTIDPRTFHLISQGRDVAIEVAGETDGVFNPGDFILFYGQKLRGDIIASQHISESNFWMTYPNGWHPQFNAMMVERYTDENAYWLSVGGAPGPRIGTVDGTPSGLAPAPDHYTATAHAEQVAYWRSTTFTGEDPFFWDYMTASGVGVTTTRAYTISLSAVVTNAVTAAVRGEVVAWAYNPSAGPDHRTRFSMNAMSTPFEDSVWDSVAPTRHRFSGQVPQTALISGVNQLKFSIIPQPAVPNDGIYFDWFEVSYARRFEAQNDQLLFSGDQIGPRQYGVSNLITNALTILDVSDPFLPRRVLSSGVASSGGLYTSTFEISSTTLVTYYVSGADVIQSAKRIERYVPPDLSGAASGADYLIITHRNFITAVQTLANYRALQGLRVKVIDVDDVYNQFNYGIYHPIAIKDFLAYAYANWQPPAPTYVLLVGDGHWNFKGYTVSTSQGVVGNAPNYMPPNISFVDPWQGEVDSSNLLVTIVGSDPLPDMLIGRLPVNTVTETNVIIAKIINYEQTPTPPDWQRHLLFVADNTPDAAGDFPNASDSVIRDLVPASYLSDRIYLNNYGCPVGSAFCPNVNYAITNTLNTTGALFVNYIGHAALQRWAGEAVLVNADIGSLTNIARLPVILSMTCLDGYWFYPNLQSLAEEILRASSGGAVATFSPTGLGVSSGHDSLERGFFTAVFADGVQELGKAALAAKVALYGTQANYDLLDTFEVLGDPALRLLTYAIDVSPAGDARTGTPATSITYTLHVMNEAFLTDTVMFSATGNAWPVSAPAGALVIPAGQSADAIISVTIPITAALNSTDRVTITIASHGDETRATAVLTTTAGPLYRVALTTTPAARSSDPDTTITYTLQVANTGNIADTYDIARSGTGWPTSVSPTSVSVPLGAMANVVVSITVPSNALAGASDVAHIQATSRSDGVNALIDLTTTADAVYGVSMAPPSAQRLGDVGQTVTYTLRLTNTGNIASTFVITPGNATWPITVAPMTLGPIGSGSGADIAVLVTIPSGGDVTDTVIITSTAQGGSWPTATSRLTTLRTLYKIFLPVVWR